MAVLTVEELTMVHILKSQRLTVKALKLSRENIMLFNELQVPHCSLIWTSYLKHLSERRKYGVRDLSADPKTFAAEAIADLRSAVMPDDLKKSGESVLEAYLEESDFDEAEGKELLSRLVKKELNRRLSRKITDNMAFAALKAEVEKADRISESLTRDDNVDQDIIKHPLADIQRYMQSSERIPLGVSFWDKASSGGGRAKEVWGVLGSTGGGKTMLTVQLNVAQALMGNDVLWLTYEQGLEGDIIERVVSNVTEYDLSLCRDKAMSELPEEVQKRYWDTIGVNAMKLHTLDFSKEESLDLSDPEDNGGIYSVWKAVNRMKTRGIRIRIVVLDWLGEMLSQIAARMGKDLDKVYQFLAQEQMRGFRNLAKEENLMVIILHQLTTKWGDAKPVQIPQKTDALNIRTFPNNMDMVFTLGKLDKHKICWFNPAKARKSDPVIETIQLEGEKARFVDAPGWTVNIDGHFCIPGKVDEITDVYDMDEEKKKEKISDRYRRSW